MPYHITYRRHVRGGERRKNGKAENPPVAVLYQGSSVGSHQTDPGYLLTENVPTRGMIVNRSIGVRIARGAVWFVLSAIACLGIAAILLWSVLWRVIDWSVPQPADARYDLYLNLGLAWAVAMAVAGLVGSSAQTSREDGKPLTWLAGCVLGMLLAFVWPLQALVIALLFTAKARNWTQWQRGAAALTGVVVLAAGAMWGNDYYEDGRRWAPNNPSATALIGTWTGASGRVLELQPDGQFLTNFIGESPYQDQSSRPPVYLAGEWSLTETSVWGRGQAIVVNGGVTFDVYGGSSPTMLCQPEDEPDEQRPCYLSLQRD